MISVFLSEDAFTDVLTYAFTNYGQKRH